MAVIAVSYTTCYAIPTTQTFYFKIFSVLLGSKNKRADHPLGQSAPVVKRCLPAVLAVRVRHVGGHRSVVGRVVTQPVALVVSE